MGAVPDADRYLELFDELNLNKVENRRIGVVILRNYYSIILSNRVRGKLDLTESFPQWDLDKQWREVLARFESVSGDFPNELVGYPFDLVGISNQVRHNDLYDPSDEIDLNTVRENCVSWATEVEEIADAYYHEWDGFSPKKQLVQIAKRNLSKILDAEPRFERFESDYSWIQDQASEAMEAVEGMDLSTERIDKELVQAVEFSYHTTNYLDQLRRQEDEYADYLANEAYEEAERRR